MASYTGLSNLKNHPHRSGFDISRKNAFTAKVGELLPVYWDISMPGDKYSFDIQYFTRTQPVETSAYTRLREYFDFYAVPLRLLWKSAPSVLTQMQDVNQLQSVSFKQNLNLGSYLPSFSLSTLSQALYFLNGGQPDRAGSSTHKNMFNFNRADLSYKLLSYLGYGNVVADYHACPDLPNTVIQTPKYWYSTSIQSVNAGIGEDYGQTFYRNMVVNAFPLLAYQKIYQDFFRWSQWEKANPMTYNVDYYDGSQAELVDTSSMPTAGDSYWNNPTMFDLRYCNWNKDLLMGVLPNSQFGDVSVISLFPDDSSKLPVLADMSVTPTSGGSSIIVPFELQAVVSSSSSGDVPGGSNRAFNFYGRNTYSSQVSLGTQTRNLYADFNSIQSSFSVLALRQAEALQHWKEISQSGDSDYREQIKKHFGVTLPAALSNLCTYIGGVARNLDISEVVNQNITGDDVATIAGKGVGVGSGKFTYTTNEHCVVMCIYHAVPLLDYSLNGQEGQLLVTDSESLPIPEFDSIGMEAVPVVQMWNSVRNSAGAAASKVFAGYAPRYFNWKTKLDVIRGAFSTTLKSWVAPVTEDILYTGASKNSLDTDTPAFFSYQLFKVSPRILDPIFGVSCDDTWDTDQLLVNSHIGCYVARNLSRDGLPY